MNDMTRVMPQFAIVPFDQMERMAIAIAKSNLFGMKTADQALALMLTAQAEGQHPATITQDYDIIQGKATRKTHSVLARYQQAGGSVEWHELTDKVADATFSPPPSSGKPLRLKWTIEMAKTAKLAGKDNWQGYARAMLRARCIAEGVRATYPAAIGGMMVSEEAQDLPERDVTPHAEPEPAKATKPDYEQTAFDTNLPKWRKLIADNKKTSGDIIATIEAKYTLSDEQRRAISGEAVIDPLAQALHAAHEIGLTDAEICKHVGVESMDALTVDHVEKVLAFVGNPMGEA